MKNPPFVNYFPIGFLYCFSTSTLVCWRVFNVHIGLSEHLVSLVSLNPLVSVAHPDPHRQRHSWEVPHGGLWLGSCLPETAPVFAGLIPMFVAFICFHVLQWAQISNFTREMALNLQDRTPCQPPGRTGWCGVFGHFFENWDPFVHGFFDSEALISSGRESHSGTAAEESLGLRVFLWGTAGTAACPAGAAQGGIVAGWWWNWKVKNGTIN